MSEYSSAEYDFLDYAGEPDEAIPDEKLKQHSQEWFQRRWGKTTGSKVADIMPGKRGEYLASRKHYLAEKVCELLTLQIPNHYVTDAMRWGVDNEAAARARYELEEQTLVELVGFVEWPGMEKLAGGSPDGLVGDDGIIEIKSPMSHNHIEWMIEGKVPDKYVWQCQFYLGCTGRKWCDFRSDDPRLGKPFHAFTIRLERDDDKIAKMREEIIKFMGEVAATIERMKKLAD